MPTGRTAILLSAVISGIVFSCGANDSAQDNSEKFIVLKKEDIKMKQGFIKSGYVPIDGGFRMEDKWVWCGSAIEDPGKGYHLYASSWRKDYPMLEGYVLFSEIVHAFSETMTGPYKFIEKILPTGNPSDWNGSMAHNPTVVKWKDKYLLYYIASTYTDLPTPPDIIQKQRSMVEQVYSKLKIGIAVADSPGGPWSIYKNPVLEARPGFWDAALVTNPAPCVLPDGRIYLYYRSNAPEGLRIGIAVASQPEGPYVRLLSDPIMTNFSVEDPFVWHNGKFFEMLAKDMKGTITGESHSGAHFISDDGIHWQSNGKAYSRKIRYENGISVVLGSLERPQLLFESDGSPKCLFAAAADGPGGFQKAENTWNIAIPIVK